jgi:hypothetical protein
MHLSRREIRNFKEPLTVSVKSHDSQALSPAEVPFSEEADVFKLRGVVIW